MSVLLLFPVYIYLFVKDGNWLVHTFTEKYLKSRLKYDNKVEFNCDLN